MVSNAEATPGFHKFCDTVVGDGANVHRNDTEAHVHKGCGVTAGQKISMKGFISRLLWARRVYLNVAEPLGKPCCRLGIVARDSNAHHPRGG